MAAKAPSSFLEAERKREREAKDFFKTLPLIKWCGLYTPIKGKEAEYIIAHERSADGGCFSDHVFGSCFS